MHSLHTFRLRSGGYCDWTSAKLLSDLRARLQHFRISSLVSTHSASSIFLKAFSGSSASCSVLLWHHCFCTDLSAWNGLQVGEKLEAVVELEKDEYLVLSFPERAGVIGFAASSDLNLQAQRSFSLGQKLQATVVALPTDNTGTVSSSEHNHSPSLQHCASELCLGADSALRGHQPSSMVLASFCDTLNLHTWSVLHVLRRCFHESTAVPAEVREPESHKD